MYKPLPEIREISSAELQDPFYQCYKCRRYFAMTGPANKYGFRKIGSIGRRRSTALVLAGWKSEMIYCPRCFGCSNLPTSATGWTHV